MNIRRRTPEYTHWPRGVDVRPRLMLLGATSGPRSLGKQPLEFDCIRGWTAIHRAPCLTCLAGVQSRHDVDCMQ